MERLKKFLRLITKYPLRIYNKTSFRATVIDSKVHKTTAIQHHADVRYSSVGRYSYISARSSVIHANIGSFCSIASGVAVGGGAHKLDAVSTSPVFSKGRNLFDKNFAVIDFFPYKTTVIGNDVWIGSRALILQGVKIGDGAVVGAGSVVTKDIPPYEIWAGNPAKFIKKRFDDETIEKLLATKWWELPDEKLNSKGYLFDNPEEFIKNFEENR